MRSRCRYSRPALGLRATRHDTTRHDTPSPLSGEGPALLPQLLDKGRTPDRTTSRTRSSGEQRGITGRAAQSDDITIRAFAQVTAQPGPVWPQLPKRMAQASSLPVDRRDLLWSTTPATWRRPVGAQRDIRGCDRSASSSPSWLTFVGGGKNRPVSSSE